MVIFTCEWQTYVGFSSLLKRLCRCIFNSPIPTNCLVPFWYSIFKPFLHCPLMSAYMDTLSFIEMSKNYNRVMKKPNQLIKTDRVGVTRGKSHNAWGENVRPSKNGSSARCVDDDFMFSKIAIVIFIFRPTLHTDRVRENFKNFGEQFVVVFRLLYELKTFV